MQSASLRAKFTLERLVRLNKHSEREYCIWRDRLIWMAKRANNRRTARWTDHLSG